MKIIIEEFDNGIKNKKLPERIAIMYKNLISFL